MLDEPVRLSNRVIGKGQKERRTVRWEAKKKVFFDAMTTSSENMDRKGRWKVEGLNIYIFNFPSGTVRDWRSLKALL